jgi:hypothetical protein
MSILLSVADLDPVVANFVKSLAMALVLLRILWTFENQMIYRLFAGYELDRTLTLRQSERSVVDIYLPRLTMKRVYSEPPPDGSISEVPSPISGTGIITRELERLTQMKNRDEIIAEIERVKREHEMRQEELSCLENLLFLCDQDNSNISKSSVNSASNRPPSNPDVESGKGGTIAAVAATMVGGLSISTPK